MPSLEALPIALVGLRGSGKTTVGRLLAAKLGRAFVDLDEETVRIAVERGVIFSGSTAGALLSRYPVATFRALELQALTLTIEAPSSKLVLATGGGAVELEASRMLLREHAFSIWLQAPLEVLAARVEADPTPRPALVQGGALAETRELAARREPWYRRVSRLEISCGAMLPEELALHVARRWSAETSGP